MNTIIPITTEYLNPSRSIEILKLKYLERNQRLYVYNFGGKRYLVFTSLVKMIHYFEKKEEPKISFYSENDLDEFLKNFPTGYLGDNYNLRLEYKYRDGANYKQYGSVIFKNSKLITPRKALKTLRKKLISTEFFVPQYWGLPKLQKYPYDPEIDHEWREVEGFEFTDEKATDDRDVSNFLNDIQKGYEV